MTEIPEDVINSMCLTWRHDFGLDAQTGSWGTTAGMSEPERNALRAQMRQIYQHHVIPAILAEREAQRERDAKIADDYVFDEHALAQATDHGHGIHEAASAIAAAIRLTPIRGR